MPTTAFSVKLSSLPLVVALALSASLVAACGSSTKATDVAAADKGISSLKVSGDVGTKPTVTWDGAISVSKVESKVLTEGDGAAIKDGDNVLTHIWVGNGYTQKTAYESFTTQAQPITLNKDTTKPLISALQGHKIGARVMVASTAKDAFGEQGNPQLGIGNKDTVIFIVDSLDIVRSAPDGAKQPAVKGFPTLIEKDGKITGWDFSNAADPTGKLQVVPLVTGDGPKVHQGSTIVTRYLGQVFKAPTFFDESYSKPDPAVFNIDGLVKGWQQGLDGVPAGSRVAIAVPPALGYGTAGNPSAKIKGTDTLYFVLDILATT